MLDHEIFVYHSPPKENGPWDEEVGTAIAGRPPYRSVRAELPHTALTLDVDWQTSHFNKDEGASASITIDDLVWRISTT